MLWQYQLPGHQWLGYGWLPNIKIDVYYGRHRWSNNTVVLFLKVTCLSINKDALNIPGQCHTCRCPAILRRQGISWNDFDLANCHWVHCKMSSLTILLIQQNIHLFVISCCFILKHLIILHVPVLLLLFGQTVAYSMMNTCNICNVCNIKVKSFSYYIQCKNCLTNHHIACINLKWDKMGSDMWHCPCCVKIYLCTTNWMMMPFTVLLVRVYLSAASDYMKSTRKS